MSAFTIACKDIENAAIERDVVIAVQRFLGSLGEPERAQLPWGLFALPLANIGHLALWSLHLSKDGPGTEDIKAGPIYGQTVELLKRAAARLAEMRQIDAARND